MARTTNFEPMVKSPSKLTIGYSKFLARQVNPTTGMLIDESTGSDTAISADSQVIPADMITNDSVGAVQNATISGSPEFLEHKSGYPEVVDAQMLTKAELEYKADLEEFIDGKGFYVLQKIVDSLNTGNVHYFSMGALSQQVEGDVLKFYSPVAVLKPELNLSIGNEWGAMPVSFAPVYRDNFTNNKLIYWDIDTTPTTRSRDYQATTLEPSNLAIGKMQFRVGAWATRAASTAEIYAPRKVVGTQDSTMPITIGGSAAYTGAVDGAFVIEIVDGGVPDGSTAGSFKYTGLDGTVSSTAWIPTDGSEVALTDGVTVVFDSAYSYTAGDKYTVGVKTASALSGSSTGIICPYPYLPVTNSIGAVSSTEISSDISYKEHKAGFPELTTLQILESASVKATANIEEIDLTSTPNTSGFGTTLVDAVFDSASTGAQYFAPVEVIIQGFDGRVLSFWIPNAQLEPSIEFAPSNDWANMPVGFKALAQSGVNMINVLNFK